jgi:hypothetical protein
MGWTHSGLFQAVQQVVVLALDERGALTHVLLFWGALERERRGTERKTGASLSSAFMSPEKQEGTKIHLDEPNFRVSIIHASLGLGAFVTSWFRCNGDNLGRGM